MALDEDGVHPGGHGGPRQERRPVGTTCRFCERTDCNMRSAPSYKFAFKVDLATKKDNFFSPIVIGDEEGGGKRRRKG